MSVVSSSRKTLKSIGINNYSKIMKFLDRSEILKIPAAVFIIIQVVNKTSLNKFFQTLNH